MLEGKLGCNRDKHQYNVCNGNLNVIYNETANEIKIRSRCKWYELGKKPLKSKISKNVGLRKKIDSGYSKNN